MFTHKRFKLYFPVLVLATLVFLLTMIRNMDFIKNINNGPKRIDQDPVIRKLENYIFQNQPWHFPPTRQKIGPLTVRAELVYEEDLELIPKIKSGKLLCREFIKNNTAYLKIGQDFMANIPRKGPERLALRAKNCTRFIEKRRYVTSSMTESERRFPLAYSILTYKDSDQVERLLRAVYRPQNVICIHVDHKASPEFVEDMERLTGCFSDNVFIASRRVDVGWGTLSLLLADLVCMRDLLNYRWKYYINLTGQEFPIRNNFELVQVFRMMRGSNEIESTLEARDEDRYVMQVDANGHMIDERLPPVPLNITVVKGNMHGSLARGFVDFMLNDPAAKIFYDWVRLTKMPEETFYATINSNPKLGAPGAYTGQNLERRVLMSRETRWHKNCGGKLVRGVCVNGIGDLPRLTNSIKFFLNKFHLDFEYLALDCFEQWFYDQSRRTYSGLEPVDLSVYRRLIVPALRHVNQPDDWDDRTSGPIME